MIVPSTVLLWPSVDTKSWNNQCCPTIVTDDGKQRVVGWKDKDYTVCIQIVNHEQEEKIKNFVTRHGSNCQENSCDICQLQLFSIEKIAGQVILYKPCQRFDTYSHSYQNVDDEPTYFSRLMKRLNYANYWIQGMLTNVEIIVPKRHIQPSNTNSKNDPKNEIPETDNNKMIYAIARNSMMIAHAYDTQSKQCSVKSFLKKSALWRLITISTRSKIEDPDGSYFISSFNAWMQAALDVILGGIVGILMLQSPNNMILPLLRFVWSLGHDRLLRDNIRWLETFPVGFKLNVPLTYNMGREITTLMTIYDSISEIVWTNTAMEILLMVLGFVSVIMGLTTLITMSIDLITVVTWHVTIMATCFRQVHNAQWYLLAASWRLFCGKKYNTLRQRTDTMEYDYMQLLFGILVFSSVLFLVTTVLVYYVFFAILHLLVQLLSAAMWIVYVGITYVPTGKWILRMKSPEWFTQSVYLEDVLVLPPNKEQFDGVIVTRLQRVPISFMAILWESLASPIIALACGLSSIPGDLLVGRYPALLHTCIQHARRK